MKTIELTPIKESTEDYEEIEKKIIELLKKELYFPILGQIGINKKILKNAINPVVSAIQDGRITFSKGQFSGRFNASISKELKSMGARWDRKTGTWRIPQSSLPIDIRNAISVSEVRFTEKLSAIDKKLSEIIPEDISKRLHIAPQFDTALWKVEKSFKKSVEKITVAPQLTDEQRERVSKEWENNMQLFVQKFTEEQIVKLRKDIKDSVFTGNRYESMTKTIQKNFGVTQSKAKFLARQETNLLMSKYKEVRYTSAGVKKYKWGCVKMPHQSANGPYIKGQVRHDHGILEGKIFSWDDPPVVNDKGDRKNPGQDYNCRCFAIPIVNFK